MVLKERDFRTCRVSQPFVFTALPYVVSGFLTQLSFSSAKAALACFLRKTHNCLIYNANTILLLYMKVWHESCLVFFNVKGHVYPCLVTLLRSLWVRPVASASCGGWSRTRDCPHEGGMVAVQIEVTVDPAGDVTSTRVPQLMGPCKRAQL